VSEKLVTDEATETATAVEKGLEALVKKAWSVLDAASEKKQPTQYLGDQAIRSIRGEG
jgi:hypothetical protein